MRPSLYEYAGGEPALLALATAHHARCLADPELNHPFTHADANPEHVVRLAAYWAEVLGGPAAYTQKYGTQPSLLEMHCGNGDLTDLGRRFVRCFDQAAEDADLPGDPEFRQVLHDYMTWAVADVLGHEETGVEQDEPMPHWGWDGLVSLP